ncbi:MAG TPA: hypothetical protein PLV92_20225 [Pirellulaceae bacterium]|nr:hypothetical protein [Pirellulaceae bacterium]
MPTLAEQMLTDALAGQKFTRKFFVVELDFSEASLEELEKQFEAAKYALRGGLTPENIDKLSTLWGAYLGEVVRRHCGAEWAAETVDGGERPIVQRGAVVVRPHAQVRARCEQGASASVVAFYEQTKQSLAAS